MNTTRLILARSNASKYFFRTKMGGDDLGFVRLVDSMGSDLTAVNAARVSFGKNSETFTSADKKLMDYLAKHKHYSPFRHCFLQFHIKAPEYVLRQLYKHIVGIETTSSHSTKDHAWNEVSGRYTKVEDFYSPKVFRKQSKDNKQCSEGIVDDNEKCKKIYNSFLLLAKSHYEELLKQGVSKEQARCILPLSQYTEVYWTASFQAIMNFIELRDHPNSQQEIREYARIMAKIVKDIYPETYDSWAKCHFKE